MWTFESDVSTHRTRTSTCVVKAAGSRLYLDQVSASTPEAGQRAATVAGRLARIGFADAARGAQLASTSGLADVEWLDALADAADPDLALRSLVHVLDSAKDGGELLASLDQDDDLRRRLVAVLGASEALGAHLARHPEHCSDLADSHIDTRPHVDAVRAALLAAVGADPEMTSPAARASDALVLDDLRVEYRRHLLGLAARDLTGQRSVDGRGRARRPRGRHPRGRPGDRPRGASARTPRTARLAVIGDGQDAAGASSTT